jgi:hypothetical protein
MIGVGFGVSASLQAHPIMQGLPASASITDNLYRIDADATGLLFGGTGAVVNLRDTASIMAAIFKVSPGVSVPGIPLVTNEMVTTLVVDAILEAKRRHLTLQQLCAGS